MHVDSPSVSADRPIALAHGSRLLLDRVAAFEPLTSTPISRIHVSQRGGFGRTLIQASDYEVPALGYVAGQDSIRAALANRAQTTPLVGRIVAWAPSRGGLSVRVRLPHGEDHEIHTRLLVLADGGLSSERESGTDEMKTVDYGQSALVAQVRTELPHRNMAYERFTDEGPLALLPHREGYALVWCTTPENAQDLCRSDDGDFLARLGATFGHRQGRFLATGERHSFPLALRYRKQSASPRVIPIGNAAQSLHPVGGQGLNLGLRDAWELASSIRSHPDRWHDDNFSSAFTRQRQQDRRIEIGLTDTLVRVFSRPGSALAMARGAMLLALDTLPPARQLLTHAMMVGARTGH